jgi:uncharacterized protein with LGFP repeats
MKKTTARAAATVGSLAIAAAFAVGCSQAKDATTSAISAGSSAAGAAGSAASSAAGAAGSVASSAAGAAGSVASSGASVAGSAVSSGASAASSVVSSVVNGTPTTMNVPGLGEVSMDGPTEAAYARLGGASALGAPTAMPQKIGDGVVQAFEKGTIFTSPAGSHQVQGEILKRYLDEQGGPAGALGWPTADETTTGGGEKVAGGGWISEFQHGEITWLNDGKGNFKETVAKK